MQIPFVDLKAQYNSIKPDIDRAIKNVLDETAFIGGRFVKEFEEKFAALYGVKHVISCANGTDSLYILMKMLGIGPDDEVITAANSWISSSETVTQTGAKVVFVDAELVYYSIDETKLEAAINPKTKALIAVHLHGQMCAIETLKIICDKRNIFLIEDCAQSHFSEYNGKRAGLYGIAGSFSFYPGKNLGAYGDAGCIITNDDGLAEKCRMYANHGSLKKHDHRIEGINSRLDGLQAAILSAKLPYILEWTEKRLLNAALYHKYLSGIEQVIIPRLRTGSKHTYHLYVILARDREKLIDHLKENGIDTAIHYPRALPNLPPYRGLGNSTVSFPVATHLQKVILSLPMYAELTEEMIKFIAEKIRQFYSDK